MQQGALSRSLTRAATLLPNLSCSRQSRSLSRASSQPASRSLQSASRICSLADAPNSPDPASTASSAAGTLHSRGAAGASLTVTARRAWEQVVRPGDTVLDATCGNGQDTLQLARLVGPQGTVVGFDVQQQAVDATQQRIDSALEPAARPKVQLWRSCHGQLLQSVQAGSVRVVCFNLGYLPAGNKAVVTKAVTTRTAVEAALQALCPGGLLSVLAYTGHPGGAEEYQAVTSLISSLPPRLWVGTETRMLTQSMAPILLLVWKREDAPDSTNNTH